MVMDRATLGHNVRPLEARRLLQLKVGVDRRRREVSLTKAGRDRLAEGRKLWRQAQRSFEAEIGRDTAATLRAMLHRIAEADFVLTAA